MNARVRQYQHALVGMGDTRPFHFWTSINVPRNEWLYPYPPSVGQEIAHTMSRPLTSVTNPRLAAYPQAQIYYQVIVGAGGGSATYTQQFWQLPAAQQHATQLRGLSWTTEGTWLIVTKCVTISQPQVVAGVPVVGASDVMQPCDILESWTFHNGSWKKNF